MKTDNKMRRTTILTTIVCLIPVILGIIFYPKLPDSIVTHWGADGTPNGWMPKIVGAVVFPGILVIVNLAFPLLLKTDPKYGNMNETVKQLLHWIIPVISVFCSGSTLAAALGQDVNIAMITPMLVGLIFTAVGNFLPKMAQSYTVGIKLPWTLNSEENWNKTHRMAGFLWVVGGIAMIILSALNMGYIGLIVIAAICVLVPAVYSYLLYRKGI